MKLKLSTVASPRLRCLSAEQLAEVAANLTVEFDCEVQPVTFSERPPANTRLPWQQVDGCGGHPIGMIKHFKNGDWV